LALPSDPLEKAGVTIRPSSGPLKHASIQSQVSIHMRPQIRFLNDFNGSATFASAHKPSGNHNEINDLV